MMTHKSDSDDKDQRKKRSSSDNSRGSSQSQDGLDSAKKLSPPNQKKNKIDLEKLKKRLDSTG